ncbi:MAG: hypothetical protein U0903_16805 [Planctomycetales bacterium]
MRVLVTGTSTFFAPRLIQGFAAQGVHVTAADDHWYSIGKSIPGTKGVRTPSLSFDPGGYLQCLIGELKKQNYDILLPTFEESLLLAEFRHEVEEYTSLLLPSFDTMWKVHHKPSLFNLCRELDIPAPPTVTNPSLSHLEEQLRGLSFPVVLKLPMSNNSVGREYCHTLPQLIERFHAVYRQEKKRHAEPPFVQQKIDGDPIYTLMLCHSGRKVGEVVYRPLRTVPENGGTSSHRESICHPQIAALTERLAEATDWSGFLGLDFIVDRRDGTPYLIDANPRANPAIQLGYLAGVDWTSLLIDLQRGHTPASVTARPGVRNSTPLLDLLWLMDALAPRRDWAQTLVSRIRNVLNPDWSLDSCHDFAGSNEWIGHITGLCQGGVAIIRSLFTGQTIGQAFMTGANYDPLTVENLRQQATFAPRPLALRPPARVASSQMISAP